MNGKDITLLKRSNDSKNNFISSIYYNLNEPSSFGSVKNLYDKIKVKNQNITRKYVENWLKSQNVYSLFKYTNSKRRRSRFISSEIDRFWMTDLIDISNYSRFNNGFKFILVVIDVLSKYLWVEPLLNKKPISVKKAFKNIIEKGRKCKILISDAGTEFNNKLFKQFLYENQIKHFIMRNTEIKASVAERVIRTLKEKIQKVISKTEDKKYIKYLDKITENYNRTIHSRTKLRPIDVNENNKNQVFLNLFSERIPNENSKFKINDKVRLLKLKKRFEKGYSSSWTNEIFIITKILKTLPFPRYQVTDLNDNKLTGSFYSFEIQKV